MTATAMPESANHAISADSVSRILVEYLRTLGPIDDDAVSADHAVAQLLKVEAEQLAELQGIEADHIYPSMTIEYGVDFGIRAATAVLTNTPQRALDVVIDLFGQIRADVRARIDAARCPGPSV